MNKQTFATNFLFDSVTYDKDADSWCFLFADKTIIVVSGFWRVLRERRIIVVSLDHGHQFGLPKPLDLVVELGNLLAGKFLTEISIDNDTADLTLVISDGIKIQIFIASAGYETYDFSYLGKRYIGLGSGELAIIEN